MVNFMKSWYKALGYYKNPFLISPMNEQTPLVGRQDERATALYHIKAGSILAILGKQGYGKTRFIRDLITNFKGKVVYVDARTISKTLDIEQLLRKKKGLSGKLFGSKPKHMVLFVDNAEELSQVNSERLKYYFDNEYLKSVIFATTAIKNCDFSESMVDRIANRIITLPSVTEDEIVEIVENRLDETLGEDDSILTKEILLEVFKHSNSVKEFLRNINKVCAKMHEEGEESVTKEHLEVLNSKEEDVVEQNIEVEHAVPDDHIVKIGKYYRDPSKEMFCSNCGAIVSDDDIECPECHAEFEEAASATEDEQEQVKSNV